MPDHVIDVARSLIQAIRTSILGYSPLQLAHENDRVILVMDSSEVASRFTIGCFITTIDAGSRWYREHFRAWNDARARSGENLSYKRVRDKTKDLKGLTEYLRVADQCPGLLVSISTPRLSQLLHSQAGDTHTHPSLEDFRNWSKKDFERLLRTAVATSVAVAVSKCDVDLTALVHDTDQLFGPLRLDAAQNLISCILSATLDVDEPIALVMKEAMADQLAAKAMFGLADFGAGGVGSFLEHTSQLYGTAEGLIVPASSTLSKKDRVILSWFACQPMRMHKAVLSYGFVEGTCHVHQISF